jgi:hypothetical protein
LQEKIRIWGVALYDKGEYKIVNYENGYLNDYDGTALMLANGAEGA